MSGFLSTDFIVTYCVVIALFGCFMAGKLSLAVSDIEISLEKLRDIASRVSADGTLHRDASEAMGEYPTANQIWRLYSRQLIESNEQFGLSAQSYVSAQSAHDYFNEETFLESVINMSGYRAVPSALTGLGILGTFLGLAAGIQSAEQFTREGIMPLLDGAGLAFYTSICGIVFSLFVTWCNKVLYFRAVRACATFSNALDNYFPVINRKNFDYQILQIMRQNTDLIRDIKSDLDESREKFQDQIDSLFRGLVEKFSQNLKVEIIKLGRSFNEALETSAEKIESSTTKFEGSVDDMGRVFEESAKAIDATGKAIADDIRTVGDALRDSMQAISDDAVKTSTGFIEENARNLENLAKTSSYIGELSSSVGGLIDRVNDCESHWLQESNELVRKNASELSRQLAEESKTFAESLAEAYRRHGDELADAYRALSDQTHDCTDRIAERYASINDFAAELEDKLRTLLSEEVRNRQGLQDQTAAITRLIAGVESLKQAVQPIEQTVAALKQIEGSLSSTLSAQAASGRTLSEASRAMSAHLEELRQSVDVTISEADLKLANIVRLLNQTVSTWNEDQRENARKLLEAADSLKQR